MKQIELLKKHALSVRGLRGQHLLIDENIQRKIVNHIQPHQDDTIVEIGSGLGALTTLLVRSGAQLIGIEKDKVFVQILERELIPYFKNFKLVSADVLKLDLKAFKPRGQKLRVVGNIPYYITSPILIQLIQARSCIDNVYLMVQREIADRFFAQPGTKAYGRLSILLRFYADVTRLFEISRTCFTPKPRVDSTMIKLQFQNATPHKWDDKLFFALVKAGFHQRRKRIVNAISDGLGKEGQLLSVSKPDVTRWLKAANIPNDARAENLMVKDFVRLTDVAHHHFLRQRLD